MNNDQLAFGIDIGGTNTKIGLFDDTGKILHFRTLPTPSHSDPIPFIKQLAQESEHILSSEMGLRLGDPRIVGVGAGAPMANYFTGSVEHAPNLGWRNVPLKKLFEENFKSRAVIENDANLAAVGEKKWGSGKGLSDFVLITLGTGVGAGLILCDKLYRGHNALGAEGGHMLIPHDRKRLCSCGGMNHLESYLSAKGIKQTIFELTGEEWTIEKLGSEFRNKDLRASTIIDTIVDELVSGLTSMAVLFGPEAFIIGGGVSKLGETFNEVIKRKLDEKVHYSLKGKVQIISATLSAEKGAVYGGAAHIFDEVSK
ncbi:MAG TPA: ROK family protein [Bacteriovoracaceae bacterium]|nr:ROK family protein [Bacteriovoracaceae bacterium]